MENPACPNCGRKMSLVRRPEKPEDQHTFKCNVCQLVFMTHDDVPIHNRLE